MSDAVDTVESGETDGSNDYTTAREVLRYIVAQLVEDPAAIEIELDDRGRKPVLNVRVGPGDMGRVIGKRGRVAQSIRTVTRAAASRDGGDVEVEFLD